MSSYQVPSEALENQPRKAQNGYMIFRGDHYNSLKAKNQDKTMTEISKIIGEMWNDLDDKRKKDYENKAEKEKDQYQKEYAAWLKKYKLDEEKVKGYFKAIKAEKAAKKASRKNKKSKDDDSDGEQEKQVQKKSVGRKAKTVDSDSDTDRNPKKSQKQQAQKAKPREKSQNRK